MIEQLRCHVEARLGAGKYSVENNFQNYRCIFERQLCLLGCFCGILYLVMVQRSESLREDQYMVVRGYSAELERNLPTIRLFDRCWRSL